MFGQPYTWAPSNNEVCILLILLLFHIVMLTLPLDGYMVLKQSAHCFANVLKPKSCVS